LVVDKSGKLKKTQKLKSGRIIFNEKLH
jgi:hypothetical protein